MVDLPWSHPLDNEKEEQLAQLMAAGSGYREAYYAVWGGRDKSTAHKKSKLPRVESRVTWLKADALRALAEHQATEDEPFPDHPAFVMPAPPIPKDLPPRVPPKPKPALPPVEEPPVMPDEEVAEIASDAALSRTLVLEMLIRNAQIAMGDRKGVAMRNGRPVKVFQRSVTGANRALELLGKELGMFEGEAKERHGRDTTEKAPIKTLDSARAVALLDKYRTGKHPSKIVGQGSVEKRKAEAGT